MDSRGLDQFNHGGRIQPRRKGDLRAWAFVDLECERIHKAVAASATVSVAYVRREPMRTMPRIGARAMARPSLWDDHRRKVQRQLFGFRPHGVRRPGRTARLRREGAGRESARVIACSCHSRAAKNLLIPAPRRAMLTVAASLFAEATRHENRLSCGRQTRDKDNGERTILPDFTRAMGIYGVRSQARRGRNT